jgi:hypothetical protein
MSNSGSLAGSERQPTVFLPAMRRLCRKPGAEKKSNRMFLNQVDNYNSSFFLKSLAD